MPLVVDHRMEDEAIDLAAVGKLQLLAPGHLDGDRILLFAEVSVVDVFLPHLERRDPDEIEERGVVERVASAKAARRACRSRGRSRIRVDLVATV